MLVILHELGHFTVAKLVGMRVEKFSLFFPPTLASKKVGETEYAIGAIPAGGYVKISGMNPDEELPPEVRDRAYHAQPVWKRIAVILAGPAVNVVVALVLLFIFWSAIGPETRTDRIGVIEKESPAAAAGLKPGDRLVSVDGKRGDTGDLSEQISSHRCPGGETARRMPGRRAGRDRGGARRRAALVLDHARGTTAPRASTARAWASATRAAASTRRCRWATRWTCRSTSSGSSRRPR